MSMFSKQFLRPRFAYQTGMPSLQYLNTSYAPNIIFKTANQNGEYQDYITTCMHTINFQQILCFQGERKEMANIIIFTNSA